MKKGIVFYHKSVNIGDDIQSLAAYKLLGDESVELIDRENLDSFESEEKIRLLANGWFLHDASRWPPSDSLNPRFISFHIAKYSNVRKTILDESLKSYYQKHGPIGCRDYETLRLFESIGVEAYYSGCLTLTLPQRKKERSNTIVITDLFINNILTGSYAKKVVHKLVPKKYHSQLKLVTHMRNNPDLTIKQKLEEAEQMLDLYASAKLVVTSRIHCALPCLALGTPVIFFDFGYVRKRNRDRFEGILDLMNTVRPSIPFHENRRIDKLIKFFGLHRLFFPFIKQLEIDWENPPPNPEKHKPIAEKLRKEVEESFG